MAYFEEFERRLQLRTAILDERKAWARWQKSIVRNDPAHKRDALEDIWIDACDNLDDLMSMQHLYDN